VLIVDDNPHNIQILAAVVNECSYKSGFAMSGYEALDFLEENTPILILLDVMMPDMNGYEVCKKIKENEYLKNIPIIFLTAKNEKEDIIKGFEVGGVDYITKPFNNMELKMRIKTHVELQQNRSKLISLNQKLEKANDTKDKFFSIIAHDLRGPIGNIEQYVDMMMDTNSEIIEDNNLTEDFNILKELSKNSYDLLENLLIWASSQRGTIDYVPTKSNIYDLVDLNIDLFKQLADRKEILLINKLNYNITGIFDYNMINTVIRNLINNSIKYTSKNGIITISASEKENEIEVIVNDNGIGMSQSVVDNLFNIDIKKYSKKGTSGETGSGFGLILCKEFIDKHNGKISVESELGKGSKFKFTLPR
ncbi:MAG: response regulator, partial [Candidatus Sericytochromatia bacterium]